MAEKKKKKH